MIFDGRDTSNSGGFTLQLIRTDGDLRVYDGDAAATVLDDGTPGFRAVEFRWHHYACVRISNVMYVYLDGVQMGSATVTSDFDSSIWTWGKYRGGDAYNILGYLDEIRIVVGTGVYTGPFAVPTARFSGSGQSAGASGSNIAAVTAAQTKLLIHSNLSSTSTSFADSATTGTTHTVASTAVIHSTLYNHAESTVVATPMAWPASGKRFGSTGAYFDGTGDFLKIDQDNNLCHNTNTSGSIDFWMLHGHTGAITSQSYPGRMPCLFAKGSGYMEIYLETDKTLKMHFYGGSSMFYQSLNKSPCNHYLLQTNRASGLDKIDLLLHQYDHAASKNQ
jgi:hypothetical protein